MTADHSTCSTYKPSHERSTGPPDISMSSSSNDGDMRDSCLGSFRNQKSTGCAGGKKKLVPVHVYKTIFFVRSALDPARLPFAAAAMHEHSAIGSSDTHQRTRHNHHCFSGPRLAMGFDRNHPSAVYAYQKNDARPRESSPIKHGSPLLSTCVIKKVHSLSPTGTNSLVSAVSSSAWRQN